MHDKPARILDGIVLPVSLFLGIKEVQIEGYRIIKSCLQTG